MFRPHLLLLTITMVYASFPAQAIRVAPRSPQMQPIEERIIPAGSVMYEVPEGWNGTIGAFCAAQKAGHLLTGGITCAGSRKGLDSTYSSYKLANCAYTGDISKVVLWQSIACQAP